MRDVKRYAFQIRRKPYGLEQVSSGNIVMYEDYDALAQRCRELDIEASRLSGWLGACDRERLAAQQERDTLRAERAQLERIARHLVRVYVVDDQSYAPETATDIALARYKEQFK